MRRWTVVFALVAFLMSVWVLLTPAPAVADVFGLGPTLVGGETKTVLPRAVKPHVPSQIVGLETYSLYGDDAGAAAAVTWKRTIGHWQVKNYDLDLRGGIIGGVKFAGDDNGSSIYGVFGELEVARLGGIVLIARADGGKLRINPGFKLNLISASF